MKLQVGDKVRINRNAMSEYKGQIGEIVATGGGFYWIRMSAQHPSLWFADGEITSVLNGLDRVLNEL